MSAGMAGVIAAHSPIGVDPESWNLGAQTRWRCFGCGAVESAESAPNHDVTKSIWHGTHLAEELANAGYGNVREALVSAADEMQEERSTWFLDESGRHWIKQTLDELRRRGREATI